MLNGTFLRDAPLKIALDQPDRRTAALEQILHRREFAEAVC